MTDNKLEQIDASGKTVTVDDVDFKIEALTIREFVKAQTIADNKNEGEALLHMVHSSLDEDISKKELKNAPAKLIVPLQEAVEEVNEFEDFLDEDEKQEALSKLQ